MQLSRVVQRAAQTIVWGALALVTTTALYASVWVWWAVWS